MKILSIDTSSKICGVTISDNEKILIHLHNDDERTHSVKLMPMIDKALKDTNLKLDDISLLAVCIGPGSFTGVRIGIATIKAFADVKNIPVVGISSLESLAYNVSWHPPHAPENSRSGLKYCDPSTVNLRSLSFLFASLSFSMMASMSGRSLYLL